MRHAAEIGALFLQAALEPHRWMAALGALASATGSLRGQLLGVDRNGELVFNHMTRLDDDLIDDFAALAGNHEAAINYRVAASAVATPGDIVAEADYARIQARTGWTPYDDVCEKHGMPFGCQTAIAHDDARLVGLALLRTRAEGPTTAEHRALFGAVAPSVRAAVRLQGMIENSGAALVRGALDAVAAPALLLDGFGRVMSVTPAAERLLAGTRRLAVAGSAITAATPTQTNDVYAAIARVLHGAVPEAALVLRGGGEPPLRLDIQALPRTEWELGFRPCAIVVLKGAGASVRHGDGLQAEFGLTASEAEVAVALASGIPRGQIAEMRGTSLGTVRQQIKSIFAKMGVNREAEFTALAATLGQH